MRRNCPPHPAALTAGVFSVRGFGGSGGLRSGGFSGALDPDVGAY